LSDVVEHVQTISDKGVIIYDAVNNNSQPNANQSSPGQSNNNQLKVTMRGTATLKCKGKFKEHRVVNGDHLWDLWTKRYDKSISWKDMLSANVFLKNPDKIYPGDYVCAPCRG
jgi:nucleoid-associated protein YgaU